MEFHKHQPSAGTLRIPYLSGAGMAAAIGRDNIVPAVTLMTTEQQQQQQQQQQQPQQQPQQQQYISLCCCILLQLVNIRHQPNL